MKHHYKLLSFSFFLLLNSFVPIQAQSPPDFPINFTWNSEVSCQVFEEGDHKDILELIGEGNCIKVCEGSTVTYTLTGYTTEWSNATQWNVSGGTILNSSTTSCTILWGTVGTASLTVEVEAYDQIHRREICVEKLNLPIAQFGIFPALEDEKTSVCSKEMIYFTNLSDANGTSQLSSYHWDFGDGTSSAEFEPAHMFSQTGEYKVTLTVRNLCNCTNSYSMTVYVEEEGIEIQCPSVVCEGQQADYSIPLELKEKCSNFNWQVTNGTIITDDGPHIKVKWDQVDASGFGYVTFNPADCDLPCYANSTIKVPIIPTSGQITGDTSVCQFSQNQYSLPQWPDTEFIWSIADDGGTGGTLTPSNQLNMVNFTAEVVGIVKIKVVYVNKLLGCGGTAEIKVEVKPRADFFGPTLVCAESNNMYHSVSAPFENWILKGPNNYQQTGLASSFSAHFPDPGQYFLSIISDEYCQNEPLVITAQPILNAPRITGPSEVCAGVPYVFTTNNTDSVDNRLHWSVTNGIIMGSEYGEEITVIFNNPSFFESPTVSVKREGLTEPFCISTEDTYGVSYMEVNANIEGNQQVCPSTYEDYSLKLNGPNGESYNDGESYTWSISPAELGSVTNVTGVGNSIQVLWNENPNNLPATLQVIVRKCGIAQPPITLPITFKPKPLTEIIVNETLICRGSPVNFSLDTTELTEWSTVEWNFDDGTTQALSGTSANSTSHTFNYRSTENLQYTVTAKIYNANGCHMITVSKNIVVVPSPVAHISAGKIFCDTETISHTFYATAEIGFGATTANQVAWYVDNDSNFLGNGFSYHATASGRYYAIVTNEYGCTMKTEVSKISLIHCGSGEPCNENLSLTAANNCGTILVTASSTSGTISSLSWSASSPGLNVTQSGNTYSATYTTAGIYNFSAGAQVEDCRTSDSVDILVPYIAGLRYKIECGNGSNMYKVTLYDNSNYFPTVSITNRIFRINGNIVYSGQNDTVELNLSAGQLYSASVEIVGNDGTDSFAPCSYATNIDLPEIPNVEVEAVASACPNEPIQFNITNANAGYEYFWDFGDQSYNTVMNPLKTYELGDDYNVKLKVKNQYGCVQEIYLPPVTIFENRLDGLLIEPAAACEGSQLTINFSQFSSSTPTSYIWMKDKEEIAQTSVPTFNAPESGKYWVKLFTAEGCVKEIDGVNAIYAKSPNLTISGPLVVCVNQSFSLTAVAEGTRSNWSFNGNSLGNNDSTIYRVHDVPGEYSYSIATTHTKNGVTCSTQAIHNVKVIPAPTTLSVDFSIIDCEDYSIKLSAQSPGSGRYIWSDGQEGTSIVVNSGGAYQVKFINEGGCSITKEIFVPRNPEEYLWVFPSGCYNLCDKSNPVLIGPFPAFTWWEWSLDNHDMQSGSETVVDYIVKDPGIYSLILDNGVCEKTSRPMHVEFQKCNCEYKVDFKVLQTQLTSMCSYAIEMTIDNPFGIPVSATLSAPNGEGIFNTSTIQIPIGGGTFYFSFIPLNEFSGGSVEVIIQSPLGEQKICRYETKLNLPDCDVEFSKTSNTKTKKSYPTEFSVYPNPASSDLNIKYRFDDDSQRIIEIYDLVGRKISNIIVDTASGLETIDIQKLSLGQYIIVLKENGYITIQKMFIKQ